MELPKRFARRGIMLYIQIAAAVVSLLLGLAQMTKESQPLIHRIQESHHQTLVRKQQEEAREKATQISQMNIPWQYKGNDGTWRYYSDPSGNYWCRMNIQGVQEYCERTQHIASNPVLTR